MMLLRALAAALLVAGLVAAGTWLVLDQRAPAILRNELTIRGLHRVVQVEEVGVPGTGELSAGDITLRDPVSREEVAHLDHLRAHVTLDGGWFSPQVDMIQGEGGRATFWRDEDGIGFVRAIEALLHGLHSPGATPAEDGSGHVPPIDIRDITVTLAAEDEAPLVVPGCDLRIKSDPEGLRIDVTVGGDGGSLVLRFGPDGLHRIEGRSLRIGAACALFLPSPARNLGHELQPSGILDVDLTLAPGHPEAARAEGVLREARLTPGRLPFPIEQASLPFHFEDGRVLMTDAHMSFPGGTLQCDLDASSTGFTLDVATHDATFRRDLLDVIPNIEKIEWMSAEDGGNVDLSLRVTQRAGEPVDVDGWGGIFLERVRAGPTGVLIEDVVGSLDVHNQVLEFHELSGRCAGGAAKLSGTLNLHTGDIVADASLYDVDIAHLDRALEIPGSESRHVAGWMQGALHWEGQLGEPRRARGAGQFSVRGGYLWRVPLLDATLRALSLSRPEERRSDSLAVRFRIRGQTFYVDDMRLDSEAVALAGDGRISRAGDLDLKITPIPMTGMLGDLLRYLQRQFVALELRGTWNAPEVRVRPFKAVTGPIGDLIHWIGGLFGAGGDEPASPFADDPPMDQPEPVSAEKQPSHP